MPHSLMPENLMEVMFHYILNTDKYLPHHQQSRHMERLAFRSFPLSFAKSQWPVPPSAVGGHPLLVDSIPPFPQLSSWCSQEPHWKWSSLFHCQFPDPSSGYVKHMMGRRFSGPQSCCITQKRLTP